MELAYMADLKSAAERLAGSNPAGSTREARESFRLVMRTTAGWRNRYCNDTS